MEFDLWIETDYLEGQVDDFCNVFVTFSDW
jgi:hypothetical protein